MRPPSTTRPPGRLGSGSLASRSSPRRERTPLLHLGKVMKITSLSLGEHCSCMTATSGLAVCGGDAPPGWVAQRTAPAAPRSAGPWSGRTRSPPPQTAYRRRPRCARCSGGPGRSVRAAMGWVWHNHYRLTARSTPCAGKPRGSAGCSAPRRALLCVHGAQVHGGAEAHGVAIVPAGWLREALGQDRVLSDANVELLAAAARRRPATGRLRDRPSPQRWSARRPGSASISRGGPGCVATLAG
jgi:hypothetical protein